MTELLLSGNAITVYEILIILILAFVLIRQMKKNRDIQERRKISNMKLRNEQLEERLKNPNASSEWSKNPNPFEVQYVQGGNQAIKTMPKVQLEVEVHTDTSVQRYLFDLDQEITIGSDERNVLSLNDKQVAKRHCSILMKNQSVYVKNVSYDSTLCIQRGKKKQLIQHQMVKIQSRDIVTIGRTALHLSLYEN